MTVPPRTPDPAPALRASDADRERVAEALRRHHVDGRLDTDELQERLGRCYAARTAAELAPLLADLPADDCARAPRRAASRFPAPLFLLLAVVLTLATVGAVAHGHPGPLPFLAFFLLLRFVVWGGPRRRRTAWGTRVP
jgi:hypothetical protein